MSAEFRVFESTRYADAIAHASAALEAAAYKEIQRVGRVYQSDPKVFAREFDRAEHLKPDQVLEVDIGGGSRLLALWEHDELTLLDVGGHEVVGGYRRAYLRKARQDRVPADSNVKPATKWLHRFFGSNPESRTVPYGTELNPEWVYFLTDQQLGFVAKVKKEFKRSSANNPAIFFVVGGPGTGKTSVLTKLLVELRAMGGNPGLMVSNPVADYIESGGIQLAGSRVDLSAPGGIASVAGRDAILVDDPASEAAVEVALDSGIGIVRIVVVGFDPCQLESDMTDEKYDRLISAYGVEAREFRACFRQKENLGRASKRVMDQVAASTPFLREDRIERFQTGHTLINRLANDMTFPNKFGYEHAYPEGTKPDVSREISRIRRGPLWKHAASLLVIVDESSEAGAWHWTNMLGGIAHQLITFNSEHGFGSAATRSIKGVEFQHVILALNYKFFDALEHGFSGTGQAAYLSRRSIRIPFTRAKDSLVAVALRPSDQVSVVSPAPFWQSVHDYRALAGAAAELNLHR